MWHAEEAIEVGCSRGSGGLLLYPYIYTFVPEGLHTGRHKGGELGCGLIGSPRLPKCVGEREGRREFENDLFLVLLSDACSWKEHLGEW